MKKILLILLSVVILSSVGFANQKTIPPYNPPYWDDLFFPASSQRINPTSSKPVYNDTEDALVFPVNDETAISHINAQLPHRWAQTRISPHVHFIQDSSTAPVFALSYRWFAIGSAPAGSYTLVTSNTLAVAYTSGRLHNLIEFPDITPPANPGLSSMIDIKLYRKTGDGASANVLVKQFDIHIEQDQPGSRQEFIK